MLTVKAHHIIVCTYLFGCLQHHRHTPYIVLFHLLVGQLTHMPFFCCCSFLRKGHVLFLSSSQTFCIQNSELILASQLTENLSANSGDAVSVLGSGRSTGVGNVNLLQYSCLENSMEREIQQATVHGFANSQTWLSNMSNEFTMIIIWSWVTEGQKCHPISFYVFHPSHRIQYILNRYLWKWF